MGITLLTPESAVAEFIREQTERKTAALINKMQYVGESVVNHAKELPSPSATDFPTYPRIPPHQPYYIDWTANLRASIGYVIVVNGKIENEFGFDFSKDGGEIGLRFAKEVARQFPEGIVLIVVAGMNYASKVSEYGYDVIESAELLADKLVPQILKQLGFK